MNLLANHRSFFSRIKTHSLMPSNSSYHIVRLMKRNLDVYKLIARKNSLVLYLKTFLIKEALLLAMQYEQNEIAEQCLSTLAIIKNLLLINSGLSVNF